MTSRTGAIRAQWEGTNAENLVTRIFGYSHRLRRRLGREFKMIKFRRNHLIATLGVMTILVTSLMSSNQAIAQGGPSVTIVGPLPVPVTGRVGISGTAPVKNIDERGRNPFMVMVHCESASSNVCNAVTPQVPVGKRLVLEHVNSSAQLRDPAGVASWEVFVHSSSGAVFATLPPHLVVDIPPLSNFAANESVLMFVEAGQSMTAEINATSVGVNMDMLFSGYLVDLSQ